MEEASNELPFERPFVNASVDEADGADSAMTAEHLLFLLVGPA